MTTSFIPDNISYSIDRSNSKTVVTPLLYQDDLNHSIFSPYDDIRTGWYLNGVNIGSQLIFSDIPTITNPSLVTELSYDISVKFEQAPSFLLSEVKLISLDSNALIPSVASFDDNDPKTLIINPNDALIANKDYLVLIESSDEELPPAIIYNFTTDNTTVENHSNYVYRYYYGSSVSNYVEGYYYSLNPTIINENHPSLGFSESISPFIILAGSENSAPYLIVNIAYTDNFKVIIQSGKFQVTGGIFTDEVNFSALDSVKGISLIPYADNDSVLQASHYRVEAFDGFGTTHPGEGASSDSIGGGAGSDTTGGGVGSDTTGGGVGSDSIGGGAGSDTTGGGAGSDTTGGGASSGSNGEDFYTTNQVGEIFSVENIVGTPYDDLIHFVGNSDDHFIDAGSGNNSIITLSGDDTVIASNGNDYIKVGDGDAFIRAGGGVNEIIAASGEHFDITAGSGNDRISIENSTSIIGLGGVSASSPPEIVGTIQGNLRSSTFTAHETRVGLNRLSFDYVAMAAGTLQTDNPIHYAGTSEHDRLIAKVVSGGQTLAYKELLPAMLMNGDVGHESISFTIDNIFASLPLQIIFTAYDVQQNSAVASVTNVKLEQEFEGNIINAGGGENIVILGNGIFNASSGSGADVYTIGVGDAKIDVGSGVGNIINSILNNGNQTFKLKLSATIQSEGNSPPPPPSSLTINQFDISASNSVLEITQARKDLIQFTFDQPITNDGAIDWRYILLPDSEVSWVMKAEYSLDSGETFEEAGEVNFVWDTSPLSDKSLYTLALLDPLLIKNGNDVIGVETGLRYQPKNEILDKAPGIAIVGGSLNDYILSSTHLYSKESINASAYIEAGALGGDVYSFRIQQLDGDIPFVFNANETLDLGTKKILDSGNSGFLTQQDSIYIEGIRSFDDMDFSRVKMVNEGFKSLEISYEQFPNFDPQSIAASKGKIQVFGEFNPSTPQYHIEKLQFSPATIDDSNVFLDSLQTYYFGIDKLSISSSGFKSVVSNTMNHVANSILVGQESNVLSEKFQINLDGDGFDSEKEIRFYGLDDGKDFIKFNSVNDSINKITIYNNTNDYVAKKYAASLDEYLKTNTTKNFDDFIQDVNPDLHDYYNNITDTDWLDQDVSNRVLVDIEFQNVGHQFLTLILDGESCELVPEDDPLLFKYYLS